MRWQGGNEEAKLLISHRNCRGGRLPRSSSREGGCQLQGVHIRQSFPSFRRAQPSLHASRTGKDRTRGARFRPPVCILALIDAGLGRKDDALRESRRAMELVPVQKDALNGTDMIHYSGIVATWVGEKDLALENLAKAAQLPGFLSYGRLKLLPWYDPLHGDPRFEKIVADLAPKN
jgi:hypothetical protein